MFPLLQAKEGNCRQNTFKIILYIANMEIGNIVAIGSVLLSLLIIYTKGIRRYVIYKQKKDERKRKREENIAYNESDKSKR